MPGTKGNRQYSPIVVTMRELSRKTGEIIGKVMDEQRPAIIKARSGIAAVIQPVNQERINQLVLEHVSDVIASRESSDQALADGETMTAAALAEELGVDLSSERAPRKMAARTGSTRRTSTGYYTSKNAGSARRRTPARRAASPQEIAASASKDKLTKAAAQSSKGTSASGKDALASGKATPASKEKPTRRI